MYITLPEMLQIVKPSLADKVTMRMYSNILHLHMNVTHPDKSTGDGYCVVDENNPQTWIFSPMIMEKYLIDNSYILTSEMFTPSEYLTEINIKDVVDTHHSFVRQLARNFKKELCGIFGEEYLPITCRGIEYTDKHIQAGESYTDVLRARLLDTKNVNAIAYTYNKLTTNTPKMCGRQKGDYKYTRDFCAWFLKKMITDGTVHMTHELSNRLIDAINKC